MIVILLVGLVALTELRALQVMLVRRGDRSLSRGSVAFVGPVGGRRGWPSKLSGCADLQPPAHTSTGRRSPGSGSRPR